MVLSDADIRKGEEVSITPFKDKNLTPNGYDLTITEVYIPSTEERIEEGVAKVPPNTWFAVSTEEYVKLGKGVCGQLWIRTSWARRGVISSFGVVDAGFKGTLTLSAFNGGTKELDIPIGERFAQIVLHGLRNEAEEGYGKRSGKYQGQRGVTLAREE
ncbi:MAG: dCTP deaminase [Thermoplasmata archaeon]|nr:dCTP deaminase [Thermoplasmata archaeon]